MKNRSLPASVCSECSFLLEELTKLQENHKFFNKGFPGFMETNTNLAADAERGLQAKDFADDRQHYGSCVIIGERAGEILKADHKL
jgi:hypothetical protein